MATKTITIKKEAYKRLKSLKNDRSFSELIMDITEDRNIDLMESFDSLKDEEIEEARERMKSFREDFEEDFGDRLQS